jgi:hypothetical protein
VSRKQKEQQNDLRIIDTYLEMQRNSSSGKTSLKNASHVLNETETKQ